MDKLSVGEIVALFNLTKKITWIAHRKSGLPVLSQGLIKGGRWSLLVGRT